MYWNLHTDTCNSSTAIAGRTQGRHLLKWVLTPAALSVEFLLRKQNDFSAQSWVSGRVRSCRKWDLDMTMDGEGTECYSSPRTAALPGRCDKEHHGKRSVSPFSSFLHQTASLQHFNIECWVHALPCRNKLTLHHIQVFIVPQRWWSATILLLFQ